MQARIGDLAIARFDGENGNKHKYHEEVCFVTGKSRGEFTFIYWSTNRRGTQVHEGALPVGRLIKARLKIDLEGIALNLEHLILDEVDECR